MDSKTIQPTIDALQAEIDRLTSARDTLIVLTGKAVTARPAPSLNKKKPTISAEGRKRIAESQRKRWAELKRKQRAALKEAKK